MNGSSASAITALTALADYANHGDRLIDAITDHMGVELTDEQNRHMRAVLVGASKTLTGHLTSREISDARRIVQDEAWAATEAEVNE